MKRLAFCIFLALSASAQAAPWTYRGTLHDGGAPANGRYDIRLSLLDAGGAKSLAYPLTFSGVEVKNGAFALDVDFGMDLAQFGALKLKTEVAQGGSGFVALGEPKAIDAKAALAGICWDTQGNAGLNFNSFLGTTDNVPLQLVTQGSRVGYFQLTDIGGGQVPTIMMGGSQNYASGRAATISGGGSDQSFSGHSASGDYATIGGGYQAYASGFASVVAGGYQNESRGDFATALGGESNCAGAQYSVALGQNAKVRPATDPNRAGLTFGCDGLTSYPGGVGDQGTYVWSDAQGVDFESTGANQYLVRAAGGVAINGTPPNANGGFEFSIYGNSPDNGFVELSLIPKLSLNGNTGERIELGVGPGGAGANDASFRIAHRNNSGGYFERVLLNSNGSVEIRSSTSVATQGVSLAAGTGAWSMLSDRRVKTAVEPVDSRAMLDKLVAMPVSEWSYIAQGEGVRHIGPMAQDFAAAFGVGENDTTISTVDADGVALAAIQGLNAKLEAENAALQSQLATLAERLARLEAARAP